MIGFMKQIKCWWCYYHLYYWCFWIRFLRPCQGYSGLSMMRINPSTATGFYSRLYHHHHGPDYSSKGRWEWWRRRTTWRGSSRSTSSSFSLSNWCRPPEVVAWDRPGFLSFRQDSILDNHILLPFTSQQQHHHHHHHDASLAQKQFSPNYSHRRRHFDHLIFGPRLHNSQQSLLPHLPRRPRSIFPTTMTSPSSTFMRGRSHRAICVWSPQVAARLAQDVMQEEQDPYDSDRDQDLEEDKSVPSIPWSARVNSKKPSPPPRDQEDNSDQDSSETPQPAPVFCVTAEYEPTGDQPQAIRKLVQQLQQGDRYSILRGVTGTGKTLVVSHVLAAFGRPTLVLCHNKTLAAQVARELRSFLRNHAVELFVSYYDRYVPEAYNEASGKYIGKKSAVNAEIDALRHRATRALLTRPDVVVVASVSCIFGLGLPKEYLDASLPLKVGQVWSSVEEFLARLDLMLYAEAHSDEDFNRGKYQVSVSAAATHQVTVWLPHEKFPWQIELAAVTLTQEATAHHDAGDTGYMVAAIREGRQRGMVLMESARIFPAKHHVTTGDRLEEACRFIEEEMRDRVKFFQQQGKQLEADRLMKRVSTDLMVLREVGYCHGVENYSRHFAGRKAGQPPETLMDYFALQGDWLLVVDESHVTLPQLKAMYVGDQSRKHMLVKHGFRLPSALDNRPLQESEFWSQVPRALFVSATPSQQEKIMAESAPVDMIIRPTYVCDPIIEVRPLKNQLVDLLGEIKARVSKDQRTLVVALTKRDAEDLSAFLAKNEVRCTYIHCGLTPHERADALKALQFGSIDCLVGVNLLREGLDLPQVSLVGILNADSQGFLRSETGLLQMVGRAARHVDGAAIFYADRITESMKKCMKETAQRREVQLEYNRNNKCEMRSTKGSTAMSIFDLLKDQITAEQSFDLVAPKKSDIKKMLSPVDDASLQVAWQRVADDEQNLIATDHIPNSPGVYFWRDTNNTILYIGKAEKLRSRVKSYLSASAKHSERIRVMLNKAVKVEFVLTPGPRDALILESNLIKLHQPPFNVLLKDDEHYPYLCASIGDPFPQFTIVPRKGEEKKGARQCYRYFGPYTSFKELHQVLDGIEEKYDLREQSLKARHSMGTQEEYRMLFDKVLREVFEGDRNEDEGSLRNQRDEYEEAGLLFESAYNKCRDIVAVAPLTENGSVAIVHVVQLRDGVVAGQFSYTCEIGAGLLDAEDLSAAVQSVLEGKHYPAGGESTSKRFSWFPDEVLLSVPLVDSKSFKRSLRRLRGEVEPHRSNVPLSVTTSAQKGPKRETDERALQFATKNAQQIALERSRSKNAPTPPQTSIDGTAARELVDLLSLQREPSRIECYDISHLQGNLAVGSRVVFLNGQPAPHLYRLFNIRSVQGIDDYASLAEVMERRFRKSWVKGQTLAKDDPWGLPDLVVIDGGQGQLNAAVKGMSKARIHPWNGQQIYGSSNHAEGQPGAVVPVCALAKDQEQVFVVGQSHPVNESPDSPALLLLRSLRDESHRFAHYSHRQRRRRRLLGNESSKEDV